MRRNRGGRGKWWIRYVNILHDYFTCYTLTPAPVPTRSYDDAMENMWRRPQNLGVEEKAELIVVTVPGSIGFDTSRVSPDVLSFLQCKMITYPNPCRPYLNSSGKKREEEEKQEAVAAAAKRSNNQKARRQEGDVGDGNEEEDEEEAVEEATAVSKARCRQRQQVVGRGGGGSKDKVEAVAVAAKAERRRRWQQRW